MPPKKPSTGGTDAYFLWVCLRIMMTAKAEQASIPSTLHQPY
jgi:hypothetical protein